MLFRAPLKSPVAKGTAALRVVFAVIAAGCSIVGGLLLVWSLPPDQQIPVGVVLVALSAALVYYETTGVSAIRARYARGDWWAGHLGVGFLIIAAVYTGFMQWTFFGSVTAAPAAKDAAAAQHVVNLEKRLNDLETRRSWLEEKIGAALPAAIKAEVDALQATIDRGSARTATPVERNAAKAAAEAIVAKRRDLSSAESRIALDKEMVETRAALAKAKERPPADAKAALLGPAYGIYLTIFCVAVIQIGQIVLGAVSGQSEAFAARAKAISLTPTEVTAPVKAIEPPKPAPAPITLKPMPPGPLALALAERNKAREAERAVVAEAQAPQPPAKTKVKTAPKKPSKEPEAPVATKLAAKLR